MSLELGTICLEVIIVLLSLLAVFRGSKFMLGFVVTFGAYLYLSLAAYNGWNFKVMEGKVPLLIFVATVTATFSIWEMYRS